MQYADAIASRTGPSRTVSTLNHDWLESWQKRVYLPYLPLKQRRVQVIMKKALDNDDTMNLPWTTSMNKHFRVRIMICSCCIGVNKEVCCYVIYFSYLLYFRTAIFCFFLRITAIQGILLFVRLLIVVIHSNNTVFGHSPSHKWNERIYSHRFNPLFVLFPLKRTVLEANIEIMFKLFLQFSAGQRFEIFHCQTVERKKRRFYVGFKVEENDIFHLLFVNRHFVKCGFFFIEFKF